MAKGKNKKQITVTLKPKKSNKKSVTQREERELTRLGSALRSLGTLGGGAVGSLVGMPNWGASAGHGMGAMISKWLGSGDYSVATNSIVRSTLKSSDSIPAMHNQVESIVVRHKEFLGEIRGSINFTVQNSFTLNPGSSDTFPWLSRTAAQFQEYRVRGLVFHYIPSSGHAVAAASPALGTIMIQTSYRATDAPPATKVEMLNEYCSSESVPSEAFCHPVECDPKENPFNVQYVRSGPIPAEDSRLMYDLGATHVATSGQQVDGGVLGDLWVTYEVELKKPIVTSNTTGLSGAYWASYTGATSPTNLFVGGGTPVGNLAITSTGNTVTFPVGSFGTYFLYLTITPSTSFTAAGTWGAPTLANCTQSVIPSTASAAQATTIGGTSPTMSRFMYLTSVIISNPRLVATVTFPAGTLTGTISGVTLGVIGYGE